MKNNLCYEMTQQRLANMSEADFDALIDAYIERMSTGQDEIPAEFFLDLLLERVASKRRRMLAAEDLPAVPG